MSREETQAKIDALSDDSKWYGGWYQPIVFPDGAMTHSTKMSDEEFYGRDSLGVRKWEKIIKPNLPIDLRGGSFLEIGSNAGLHLRMADAEGSDVVWGCENHIQFLKQSMLVNEAHGGRWETFQMGAQCLAQSTADQGLVYDITLLSNSLYWIGYSDADGFVPDYENKLNQFIENLSRVTRYVLIVGSEQNSRSKWTANPRKHDIGASLADVVPRLEPHFEIITAKEHRCDRHLNVISGRSKNAA